jgi:cellulose synthase/poly-beta-1,6-N-acetylglucosamine synthase-like glycosyltransferase
MPSTVLPVASRRTVSPAPALGDLELAIATLPTRTHRVVVLVPAHNEEASLDLALDSLMGQTRRPELVVVIPDNCTDGTADMARARGDVVVAPTVGNAHKKAGALNQILDRALPLLQAGDAVLVMDADSALDERFIEAAMSRLGTHESSRSSRKMIGGVGGTFRGGRGGGFVGMLQRNEYARYARDVRRLRGRVLVLTGTAAMFRVDVLRRVVHARAEGLLPGDQARVYDTNVLTEDNELTLALLHLGYAIVSPQECLLETEVMTDWRSLWKQRLRWKRGALENLMDYGWTGVTSRYWGRQLLTHVGVLVTAVYLLTLLGSLAFTGTLHLHPIWMAVTVIFVAERVVSVRQRGGWQMVLAATLIVEMAFDLFLQATQAKAAWDTVTRTERTW